MDPEYYYKREQSSSVVNKCSTSSLIETSKSEIDPIMEEEDWQVNTNDPNKSEIIPPSVKILSYYSQVQLNPFNANSQKQLANFESKDSFLNEINKNCNNQNLSGGSKGSQTSSNLSSFYEAPIQGLFKGLNSTLQQLSNSVSGASLEIDKDSNKSQTLQSKNILQKQVHKSKFLIDQQQQFFNQHDKLISTDALQRSNSLSDEFEELQYREDYEQDNTLKKQQRQNQELEKHQLTMIQETVREEQIVSSLSFKNNHSQVNQKSDASSSNFKNTSKLLQQVSDSIKNESYKSNKKSGSQSYSKSQTKKSEKIMNEIIQEKPSEQYLNESQYSLKEKQQVPTKLQKEKCLIF